MSTYFGFCMITSLDGHHFRVTCPFWGESTRYRWIPSDTGFDVFCDVGLTTVEQTVELQEIFSLWLHCNAPQLVKLKYYYMYLALSIVNHISTIMLLISINSYTIHEHDLHDICEFTFHIGHSRYSYDMTISLKPMTNVRLRNKISS